MDDATKKMLVSIAAPIIRKGLISAGSALTAHGLMSSNYTEAFVSLGLALAGAACSSSRANSMQISNSILAASWARSRRPVQLRSP